MSDSLLLNVPEAINKILENYKIVVVPKDSQLVQLKHGHWIEHHEPYTWMGYTYWSCSECGFECGYEKDIKFTTNHCPNCGARMDR